MGRQVFREYAGVTDCELLQRADGSADPLVRELARRWRRSVADCEQSRLLLRVANERMGTHPHREA